MAKAKDLDPVRFVVIVAIGAALYGLGGMIGYRSSQIHIKPAMDYRLLRTLQMGVGFLGIPCHGLPPFMGLGRGSPGFSAAVWLGHDRTLQVLEQIVFEGKLPECRFFFIVISFFANFLGTWSAPTRFSVVCEPLDKIFTQQVLQQPPTR